MKIQLKALNVSTPSHLSRRAGLESLLGWFLSLFLQQRVFRDFNPVKDSKLSFFRKHKPKTKEERKGGRHVRRSERECVFLSRLPPLTPTGLGRCLCRRFLLIKREFFLLTSPKRLLIEGHMCFGIFSVLFVLLQSLYLTI